MNILANAIDALEEFHTTRTYQDRQAQPSQIVMRTSFLNRQWAEIAIADNGAGTPKAIQSQIFEPFFTTKPAGKSTRMGISIRHQMIAKKTQRSLDLSFCTGSRGRIFNSDPCATANLCRELKGRGGMPRNLGLGLQPILMLNSNSFLE